MAASTDFEFIPPPEAPVFEPSEEEFSDPLGYINKIRAIAEQTGICKIKPPPEWQPPFAVDVDNFKFTPRIQRLNELEAKTRIKLNFLDKIAKFWELQGSSLKIPTIERKALDLHALHQIVQDEGGFECVTKDRKWTRIAQRMGYAAGKSIGSLLRTHYERILFPYAIFKSGASLDLKITDEGHDIDKKDKDYVPHGIPSRQAIKPPAERYSRRSKRHAKDTVTVLDVEECPTRPDGRDHHSEDLVDYNVNSELKKLQCYGAGPKMPGFTPKSAAEDGAQEDVATPSHVVATEESQEAEAPLISNDPIDQIMCQTCGRGDAEESMLLCDGCDDSYHTFCLLPPLNEIPKGDWRCPFCIAMECRKPHEAFGFEQATKEYTLQSFGEMADQFKGDYFNMPVHMVPPSTVEREFWRIVSAIDEDVTVEYGADLHTMDHGSGFPTRNGKACNPGDEEYACSGWNLNNLPVLEGSVLSHINADISGMKIPWMYVGMCFATFCWHNEDHWSYSINYLHWGEPKTWYGVPGSKAEEFEETMKKAAPELFETQPDLLHQLVTIMNPNILMSSGVPVYRTNQCAGEFVVTFPRAYHAGFNQGYNFAEAVNFCPSDWLSLGRMCIDHYSKLHRFCVFSHDELVCKMAADPEILDLNMAAATYQDMLQMVEREKNLRKTLLEKGVTVAEREPFELLPDDERQCDVCKTTCFLSAVTCVCTKSIVCIKHVDQLCACPSSKLCLRYRYTLDELPLMLHRLKIRAESFDNWAVKVKNSLEANTDDKLDLGEMKALIAEAEDKRFPESELLKLLIVAVEDAEKCATVAQQLVSKKVRTRHRQAGEGKYTARLSLEELQLFSEQIDNLPCEIAEGALVKDLLCNVMDFQRDAKELLGEEVPSSKGLERLLDVGLSLDIDLAEIPSLKKKLLQVTWLEEVNGTLKERSQVTVETMQRLIESGGNLPPHAMLEKQMAKLQELLVQVERWEDKAKLCLQAKPRHTVATLEAIVTDSKNVAAYLPNILALKDAVKKAKEWSCKVDAVQNGEHYPYLDVLENLVNKGRPIPVRLELLPQVESQLTAAKSWRERTARTFLKKNTSYSLVEVLSPRTDVGIYPNSKVKKKKLRDACFERREERDIFGGPDCKEDVKDPAAIVAQFKHAEQMEAESMRLLRFENLKKRAEDVGDSKYCVCRKVLSGMMLQCELCKDWFHAHCVPLPKIAAMKGKGNSTTTAIAQLAKELKFLCPLCLRSRRPRLETILSLLVSLQKLPVRLPEGEALQCLTERAMSWQDRARQALATEELAAALAKLSVLSQRLVEQAAREKTEKIINAELMKAANNPELQPHVHNMAQKAFVGDSLHSYASDGGSGVKQEKLSEFGDGNTSRRASSAPNADDTSSTDHLAEGDLPNIFSSSEHAYSSASKPCPSQSQRKHSRKSPLIPRQLEAPVLELSEMGKGQLEELMMEGDLLEVSLDETQHIWRILQATKPMADERFPDVEDLDGGSLSRGKEKNRMKKRKMDEEDGQKFRIKEKLKVRKLLHREDGTKIKRKKIRIDKEGRVVPRGMRENACKENVDGANRKMKKFGVKKEVGGEVGICRKRVKKTAGRGEGSDAEEDKCAAARCFRPTGEVNWVQCDGGCDLWFHLMCVGLSKSDVSESEDYICACCAKQKPETKPDIGTEHEVTQRESCLAEGEDAAKLTVEDEEDYGFEFEEDDEYEEEDDEEDDEFFEEGGAMEAMRLSQNFLDLDAFKRESDVALEGETLLE